MFEHVGISSFDIVTEVEMHGAACLWEKVSKRNVEMGIRSGVPFQERME